MNLGDGLLRLVHHSDPHIVIQSLHGYDGSIDLSRADGADGHVNRIRFIIWKGLKGYKFVLCPGNGAFSKMAILVRQSDDKQLNVLGLPPFGTNRPCFTQFYNPHICITAEHQRLATSENSVDHTKFVVGIASQTRCLQHGSES